MALKFDADYLSLAVGDKQWENSLNIQLVRHNIGKIKIISGQLVACDPYTMDISIGEKAFTQALPIGEYPVHVTIAHYLNHNDRRITFATICLNDHKPVRWEMMLLPEQNMSQLDDDQIWGYPVDFGIACFTDRDVAQFVEADNSIEKIFDKLEKDMQSRYKHTYRWGSVDIAEGNMIAFSSGWGDGMYPTFAGFDEDDQLTAVVTDFMCFYHEYHKTGEDVETD